MGIDPKAVTPAVALEDGDDYVPEPAFVVLVTSFHPSQVLDQ